MRTRLRIASFGEHVMKEFVVSAREAGGRFDKYLAKLLPKAPKSLIYKALRKKNITLSGKKAEGNEILKEGDCIKVFFSDDTFDKFSSDKATVIENNPLKNYLIFENEELLIINKPAGLLSQKAESDDVSLCEYIADYLDDANGFAPGISNRLDRNTSGIIVAGKSLSASQALSKVLRDRTADKYYLAIAYGSLDRQINFEAYITKDSASNTVSISPQKIEGADYINTIVTPIGTSEGYSLLKLKLVTGKTHQIRATLKELGLPIVGDSKYGVSVSGIRRQMLHAYSISFPSEFEIKAAAGKTFTAKLPDDFSSALRRFGLNQYGF